MLNQRICKNWFKSLTEVKDLMTNYSGSMVTEEEFVSFDKYQKRPARYFITTVELGDCRVTLKEKYLFWNENNNYDVRGDYSLLLEKGDGHQSVIDFTHWFGAVDDPFCGNEDSYELNNKTGIFYNITPSQLPTIYKTCFYLNYDGLTSNVLFNAI